MLKRKRIREKGKLKPSAHLAKFHEGEQVIIKKALGTNIRRQMQGVNARIVGKQGKAYIVGFLNGARYKTIVLMPIHLKKKNK